MPDREDMTRTIKILSGATLDRCRTHPYGGVRCPAGFDVFSEFAGNTV